MRIYFGACQEKYAGLRPSNKLQYIPLQDIIYLRIKGVKQHRNILVILKMWSTSIGARGSKQSCCTNIGFWSKFLFYLLLSSGYPWPGHHYWTMHLDAKAWPPIEGRPPGHHLVHSSGDFAVLWGSQKPWREMTPSTCLLIHVPSLYCICLLTLKSLSGNNTPCLDCSIMIQGGAAPEL